MEERTKEKAHQEDSANYRLSTELDWWVSNNLRISGHAIERAREYGPSSFSKLTNKELGEILARTALSQQADTRVIDHYSPPRVAVELKYASNIIGFLVLAQDQNDHGIVVGVTVLDRQAWQLYGNYKATIPLWYKDFIK